MKKATIFDCEIASTTLDETVNQVDKIIKNKKYTQHVVLNASKVVLMQKNQELKNIITNCSLINADGQSIVWASKLLGKELPERVTGIDLMERLVKLSDEKGYGIYFLGAKEEVVEKVVNHYKYKYPQLKVSGFHHGYFNKNDETDLLVNIRKSNADILFVAFSSPQKEYWLAKHGENLGVPFCMGVGGSFDVIAGTTKRAPLWMQRFGLEWFFRFLQEPKRMWKRYLVGNTKFIYLVMKEFLQKR